MPVLDPVLLPELELPLEEDDVFAALLSVVAFEVGELDDDELLSLEDSLEYSSSSSQSSSLSLSVLEEESLEESSLLEDEALSFDDVFTALLLAAATLSDDDVWSSLDPVEVEASSCLW